MNFLPNSIRMLAEPAKKIDEHSKNFNKELENSKKNQSEAKISSLKFMWEGVAQVY